MKFDVICGNPPYQTKSEASVTKTQSLWHKFVHKSFDLLKDGGYLCLVHPSGWRNVNGRFEETKNLLLSKDIRHVEMYDKEQGFKTFGARTMYDWYVLQNVPSTTRSTTIRGQDGKLSSVNLSRFQFVPSGMFSEIESLIAKDGEPTVEVARDASNFHTQHPNMSKDGEERVEVLYDRTAYGSDKKNMSKEKVGKFQHPCVYMVRVNDEPVTWCSSTNTNGHFGVPKLIWGNGGYEMGSLIDATGEYGLTQFAYGIVDTPKNLPLIKKAFDSEKFRNLMRYCDGGDSNINRKVIALFRKDFWKQFID